MEESAYRPTHKNTPEQDSTTSGDEYVDWSFFRQEMERRAASIPDERTPLEQHSPTHGDEDENSSLVIQELVRRAASPPTTLENSMEQGFIHLWDEDENWTYVR